MYKRQVEGVLVVEVEHKEDANTVTLTVTSSVFPELSVANKVTCLTPTSSQLKLRSPFFKNPLEFLLFELESQVLHWFGSSVFLYDLLIPKDSNKQLSELPLFIWSFVIVAIPLLLNWTTISLPLATGFSSSITVTVCVAVAILPAESSTVHVTVVTPIWKVSGASFVTDATLQSSFVISVPKSTPVFVHDPGSTPTIGLESIRMVGSVLSLKKTFWVAVDVFPDESLTVHVTTVFPVGKVAGALLEIV